MRIRITKICSEFLDGASSKQDRLVREYNAMHEEHFLSSWLRADKEGEAEEAKEMRRR